MYYRNWCNVFTSPPTQFNKESLLYISVSELMIRLKKEKNSHVMPQSVDSSSAISLLN